MALKRVNGEADEGIASHRRRQSRGDPNEEKTIMKMAYLGDGLKRQATI